MERGNILLVPALFIIESRKERVFMKKKILLFLLALSLLICAIPKIHVLQAAFTGQDILTAEKLSDSSGEVFPTEKEAYDTMIAMKKDYPEEMAWTDASSGSYKWKGGKGPNGEIAESGTGCVNFAFRLSDAVFDSIPARMLVNGKFSFEDIKAGDILRMDGNSHSVIVLQALDDLLVIAEGNYNGKVHWGRTLSKDEVLTANYVLTRYPEGYVSPDDPEADKEIAKGELIGGLNWLLVKSGTLTISGSGAMPDFDSNGGPWNTYSDKIFKIVIGNGATSIGNNAFRGNEAYSISIPASVTAIGDDAFRECKNIMSVTIPEGVAKTGERAFQSCGNLRDITFPASIEQIGAGAFFQCQELKSAVFLPGEKLVQIGNNMFQGCWRLTDVTLPRKMDHIGKDMFSGTGISSLIIPDGVDIIDERAFASCKNLKSVTIPSSVKQIGIAAFSDCSMTDIYFCGSKEVWDAINKIGDTQTTLSGKTIHYNYVITPGPSPSTSPGPVIDGDVNTGIYSDSSHTALAPLSMRTHYVNGGNVKQADGTRNNYKTKYYYTKLQASDIVTTDSKGKTKTKKGRIVVGITSSNEVPVLVKEKIKDSSASKTALASISRGKIKVTAKSQPGTVYLWAVDTGDAKASACAKIVIKAAPSKVQIFAKSSSSEGFSHDNKSIYKKDVIELGSTTKLYVYPSYKLNRQMKETKDASYSVSFLKQSGNYFTAKQDPDDPYCFNITAKTLKNNKKTTGKVIVTCNENGKKAVFTATAVNGVQNISFNSITGMTCTTASGAAVSEFTIERSDTDKKTGSFVMSTGKSSSSFETTDKVKLYAMGSADGFDQAQMKKGKVKITSKPDSGQRALKAKLEKDKKTVTVTAAKKIPAKTSVYYLIMYNNKENLGYKIIKITTV